MRARRLIVVVLVGVLSLTLVGCARLTQAFKPAPKVISVEATVAAPGAPVSGQLAQGEPSGLPLWPHATVENSRLRKVPAGMSWTAVLTTTDPYGDVMKGVAAGFQKAGWNVTALDVGTTQTPTAVLTVSRSNADGLVTVAKRPGTITSIDIVITPKK